MLFIRELLIEAVNFFFFIKYITYLKGDLYYWFMILFVKYIVLIRGIIIKD